MIWAPPHEEEVVEGSSSIDVAIPDQNEGVVFQFRESFFDKDRTLLPELSAYQGYL